MIEKSEQSAPHLSDERGNIMSKCVHVSKHSSNTIGRAVLVVGVPTRVRPTQFSRVRGHCAETRRKGDRSSQFF